MSDVILSIFKITKMVKCLKLIQVYFLAVMFTIEYLMFPVCNKNARSLLVVLSLLTGVISYRLLLMFVVSLNSLSLLGWLIDRYLRQFKEFMRDNKL